MELNSERSRTMARVVARRKCILLVENDLPLQGVLREAIVSAPGFNRAAVCAAKSAALQVIETTPLDIVLVSLHLEDGSGLDVVRAVRKFQPQCEVLVIGTADDKEGVFASMQAGASGYLLKENFSGAERVCRRSIVVSVAFSQILANLPKMSRAPARTQVNLSELSAAQGDILRCVASGLSNKEIARKMLMSSYNVDYHLRCLRKRFLVHNRAQLVRAALTLFQS